MLLRQTQSQSYFLTMAREARPISLSLLVAILPSHAFAQLFPLICIIKHKQPLHIQNATMQQTIED